MFRFVCLFLQYFKRGSLSDIVNLP